MNKINMMRWARDLFPICRSLTGEGNRKTIKYIQMNINKSFKLKRVRSNSKFFDWKTPPEWKVEEAYIEDYRGNKICDFKKNNLHLLNYSIPVNKKISFRELKKHIFYLKNKPDAIPYVTSYYKKNWGFCMSYNKFKKIDKKEKFKVVIKSDHFNGFLDYTEMLIKGQSSKEILIVSYICHPSLANNELSGPLLVMALSKILKKSKYSVRLVLLPETIGAITYISKNFKELKDKLIAGFNLSCVGDAGPFTLISSLDGNTYADKISRRVLKRYKRFKELSFLKRGSNERQFGCQNLKLPFVTLCRTRFGDFKEYHTSDDNLSFINNTNLLKSLDAVVNIIDEIQKNKIFQKSIFCEPFLTKHNLFNNSRETINLSNQKILDICAIADRNYDLVEIAKKIKTSKNRVQALVNILSKKKILNEFR